jgi:hypothetical protein
LEDARRRKLHVAAAEEFLDFLKLITRTYPPPPPARASALR